jgi:HD-GYP domain-containing protein (c-di-GMP phosphodiesterase class II)
VQKILIFSLLLLLTQPIVFSQSAVAENFYNEGVKFYVLNDFESALDKLQSAYRVDPESTKIRNLYVNTLIKLGESDLEAKENDSAAEYFKEAFELSQNPNVKQSLLELIEVIDPQLAESLAPPKSAQVSDPTPTGDTGTVSSEQSLASSGTQNSSQELPSINFEVPIELDSFLQTQTQENLNVIRTLIETQSKQNQQFSDALGSMLESQTALINSQQSERSFFQQYTIILIVGLGVILIIILLISFLLIRRRPMAQDPSMRFAGSLAGGKEELLLAGTSIDERKLIGNENYEDIVKVKKLSKLHEQLQSGNVDWNSIQVYLAELNNEIKGELLSLVENHLDSKNSRSEVESILLPFQTDHRSEIRSRSEEIMKNITDDSSHFLAIEEGAGKETDSVLNTAYLVHEANMIDAKSGRPGHTRKVSKLVFEISKRLDEPEVDPEDAAKAALIYDIGLLEIPDEVLKKPDSLTKDEMVLMRSHTEKGISFFSHVELPEHFSHAIKFHHERIDGSGYPFGLSGKDIPQISRIIAISDMFCAMTRERAYKEALTPGMAMKLMKEVSGTLIDPDIFAVLQTYLEEFKEESQ